MHIILTTIALKRYHTIWFTPGPLPSPVPPIAQVIPFHISALYHQYHNILHQITITYLPLHQFYSRSSTTEHQLDISPPHETITAHPYTLDRLNDAGLTRHSGLNIAPNTHAGYTYGIFSQRHDTGTQDSTHELIFRRTRKETETRPSKDDCSIYTKCV